MDKAEAEEELSEWVEIQSSSHKSPPIDACTIQNSPVLQPNHRREHPPDDEDDDEEGSVVVPVVGEEGESCLSLPWLVIETAKKRLIKDSVIFFQAVERTLSDYVTRRRVLWSLAVIGGFSVVSSLVHVKLVRWWRRLQEEKLRFLLLLVREKDQKIKELMVEIERLNQLLLSRRRVRVARFV